MFKMLIGITFLNVIADIMLTESSFKKYIKAIIGLFTVAIIVQGIFGMKSLAIDYSIIERIENEAYENIYVLEDDIKNEMLNDVKKNIIERLLEDGIKTKELEINIDENLNIINLVLRLENPAFNEKAISILSEEFYIDKKVIGVG